MLLYSKKKMFIHFIKPLNLISKTHSKHFLKDSYRLKISQFRITNFTQSKLRAIA